MDDARKHGARPPVRQRLLWFAGLYLASLVGFVTFVYVFKAFIPR